MTGSERRTTQRFQMRLPLTVRWTTGAAVGETSTESRDVSSRGVYFFLAKDVKEGSPVEILLTLPNEIELSGFLLAHCGGGQDKPGFLGPSAETPALFLRDYHQASSRPTPRSSRRVKIHVIKHSKDQAPASGYLFAALSLGAGDFHDTFRRG